MTVFSAINTSTQNPLDPQTWDLDQDNLYHYYKQVDKHIIRGLRELGAVNFPKEKTLRFLKNLESLETGDVAIKSALRKIAKDPENTYSADFLRAVWNTAYNEIGKPVIQIAVDELTHCDESCFSQSSQRIFSFLCEIALHCPENDTVISALRRVFYLAPEFAVRQSIATAKSLANENSAEQIDSLFAKLCRSLFDKVAHSMHGYSNDIMVDQVESLIDSLRFMLIRASKKTNLLQQMSNSIVDNASHLLPFKDMFSALMSLPEAEEFYSDLDQKISTSTTTVCPCLNTPRTDFPSLIFP